MIIECHVASLSKLGPDGLPAVELYMPSDVPFAQPAEGVRAAIRLHTQDGEFFGGLRMYAETCQPYICPDLVAVDGDEKVSLARVLLNTGYVAGDTILVHVEVDGAVWIVFPTKTSN